MARALVTGCAGFIGSQVAEALLAADHDVIGIDCFTDNYPREHKQANLVPAREHDRFTFVNGDLVTTDVEALLDGCDAVFHLAAEPGVRSSWGQRFDRYLRNNIRATQRLLEASARTPERRIVYASSSSVYGESEALPTPEDATPQPLSPYGVTKLAAEQLCRLYHANHGVDAVALRFFSVYGPRQRPDMAFRRFCEAAAAGAPIEIYGDGRQTRDFTFVGDVVAAVLAAAARRRGRRRGLQHRRRLAREPRRHARAARRDRRSAARRPPPRARVRRRAGHRRRHRARARGARLRARHRLREGLRAEFEWVLEHSRTRRGGAVASAG